MLKNKNSVQNIKDSLKDHEFPISNGRIIDLKTSKIRERKLEDYCFYESPVSLVDKTPNADKFFGSLMKFDKDLVDVLQTILGYSITGSTDEKAFFIMYGSTANNGKSTLVSVLQSILGPYYHTGNKSLIIQEKNKSYDKPNPELLSLIGKRVVAMSENRQDEKLDESSWKNLVGNDEQSARTLYSKELIKFKPKCKFIFLVNKPLLIDVSDSGSVNRIYNIPFDAIFSKKPKQGEYLADEDFIKKLCSEYRNEVFTWLVQGASKFYQNGIRENQKLIELKNEYIKKIDIHQRFIKSNIKQEDGNFLRKSEVKSAFRDFLTQEQLYNVHFNNKSVNKLYEKIALEYVQVKNNGYSGFKSCSLVESEDAEYELVQDGNNDESYKIQLNREKEKNQELLKKLQKMKEDNAKLLKQLRQPIRRDEIVDIIKEENEKFLKQFEQYKSGEIIQEVDTVNEQESEEVDEEEDVCEKDLEKMREEMKQLMEQNKKLKTKNAELVNDINEYKVLVETEREHYENACNRIDLVEEHYNKLKTKNDELVSDINEYKVLVKTEREHYENACNRIDVVESLNKKLIKEKEDLLQTVSNINETPEIEKRVDFDKSNLNDESSFSNYDGLDDDDAFDMIGSDDEPETAPTDKKSDETQEEEQVCKKLMSQMKKKKRVKRTKVDNFTFNL